MEVESLWPQKRSTGPVNMDIFDHVQLFGRLDFRAFVSKRALESHIAIIREEIKNWSKINQNYSISIIL